MVFSSKTERKNALAGRGPIVDRARQGLYKIAGQFGTITKKTDTQAFVTTDDGLDLVLAYDMGNYLFSRVYNLTITANVPVDRGLPHNLVLSHKSKEGPFLEPAKGAGMITETSQRNLDAFNKDLLVRLKSIDLLKLDISIKDDASRITVIPIGGSFVWVFIPPIFQPTSFPQGEQKRIIELVRAISSWRS